MSANAYAIHRGVSPPAVLKAIRTGRIAKAARKAGREWEIDCALADSLWSGNTDPSMQREQPTTPAEKAEQLALFEAARPDASAKSQPDTTSSLTLIKARAVGEGYRARLAQLEYERKAGLSLDAGEVQREFRALGRTLRERLYQIPVQLGPELATISDVREIERRIRQAIEDALLELTSSASTNGTSEPTS